jgi:hypothetical protein
MSPSHDSKFTASHELQQVFVTHIQATLAVCSRRVADRMHFEQVRSRLERNQDLSNELPQLKNLTKRTAIATINGLIKRCNDDLKKYWLLPASDQIKSTAKAEFHDHQPLPHFKVTYFFRTELGSVKFDISTKGNYFLINTKTISVKQANVGRALQEVEQQIMLLQIQNAWRLG